MTSTRSSFLPVLVLFALVGCATDEADAPDQDSARLAAEKEGPCALALWRIEAATSACRVSTRALRWNEWVAAGESNEAQIGAIADCYEATSCESLAVLESKGLAEEPILEEVTACIGTAARAHGTGVACRTAAPAEAPKPEEGPLKASDPACQSGRSVCAYNEAKEREYCMDCKTLCAQTYGSRCDPSRSCSGSCYDVQCDAAERERCSDFLEGS